MHLDIPWYNSSFESPMHSRRFTEAVEKGQIDIVKIVTTISKTPTSDGYVSNITKTVSKVPVDFKVHKMPTGSQYSYVDVRNRRGQYNVTALTDNLDFSVFKAGDLLCFNYSISKIVEVKDSKTIIVEDFVGA
jgi:hypothetical protein